MPDGMREIDGDDGLAAQGDHHAEAAGVDQIDCRDSESRWLGGPVFQS
jgi:hypothetical protein